MPKMTDDEFTNFVTANIRSSLRYIDSSIAKRRERAMNYIQYTMPDLPSLKGRSSVVDGTLSSQLDLMMPGLMRVLTGGPLIGEYNATHPEEEQAAKEATLYVNNVVLKLDNEGESLIYNWLFDGLSQILGVVKGWWEEDIREEEETLEGLTPEQLVLIATKIETDPSLEITAHEEKDGLHTLTVKQTVNKSKLCLDVIPPEEVVVSSDARVFKKAVLRSHRTYKRAGELIDMGYSRKVVDELPTYAPYDIAQLSLSRGQVVDWGTNVTDDSDMRMIAVHQGIIRCNKDGKGIKEWYFVAGGNEEATTILECEEYDNQIFFADFCPKPIPHTVFGRCVADDLMPIQLVKTAILRQTLDNLYQTNSPQRIVIASQLQKGGLEALMNKVPNGLVLANSTEAVKDLATPFFAKESFPMLSYFDDEAEKRTGVSRASMGLDPDVLQNQSATAANIAQSASMGKLEMIARIMATGGMRDLFRGILDMLKKYQDFPRLMKVGDELKPVDPRKWAQFDTWDVTINTGLGTGSHEKDMAVLGLIAMKQEQVLLQGGPQNGIITMGQYANTVRKMVETAGFHNSKQFVNDVPIEFTPPMPETPPDPKMEKVKADAAADQARFQAERQEAQARFAMDAQQAQADHRLKLEETAANFRLKAETDAEQIRSENALAIQRMRNESALKIAEMERAHELRLIEIAAEAKLKAYEIDKHAETAQSTNIKRPE